MYFLYRTYSRARIPTGLGRGEATAVRVVQRLREDRQQTAHGHRRSGSRRAQLQRFDVLSV